MRIRTTALLVAGFLVVGTAQAQPFYEARAWCGSTGGGGEGNVNSGSTPPYLAVQDSTGCMAFNQNSYATALVDNGVSSLFISSDICPPPNLQSLEETRTTWQWNDFFATGPYGAQTQVFGQMYLEYRYDVRQGIGASQLLLGGTVPFFELAPTGGAWVPISLPISFRIDFISTLDVKFQLTNGVFVGETVIGDAELRINPCGPMFGEFNLPDVFIQSAQAGVIDSVWTGGAPCCTADVTTQGAGVGDPGYGVPDGLVTAADVNYYINFWVAGDLAVADLTTQGAGVGDPGYGVPDGLVTAADVNYYINFWVAGCP